MRFLLFILLLSVPVFGANYHVSTTGNNGNAGATNSPWLTVTYAETQMAAGDNLYIEAGTYEEAPTVNVSGNSGAWINLIGDSGAVLRGIHLTSVSYVRVINIKFTQTDSTYGNTPVSQSNCSNVQWIDNYIHNTYMQATTSGIHCTGTMSDNVYRGNRIEYLGSVNSEGRSTGINSDYSAGVPHHLIAEYNIITRVNDYITLYGTNNIYRNNSLTDHDCSYWVNKGTYHADQFQATSDGAQTYGRGHIYERNYAGENHCMGGSENVANGHFLLLQDSDAYGDTNFLARGNVVFSMSDGAIGGRNVPSGSRTYQNTFDDITNSVFIAYNIPSTDLMFDSSVISAFSGGSGNAIQLLDGATGSVGFNWGYNAGAEASYLGTADPLFVNPSTRDYRLQSGSPLINAGNPDIITIESASGSGTSFDVNNGQLLCDGWGMVEGDVVTINGTATRVVTIVGDTVTVATSVTWTLGDSVFWGTDSDPDIGALPYGSTELTAATISNVGTTYTVTPTGDARGVWFYQNGVPHTWDYEAPYTATIAGGVTAKAYALYAQETPVVTATTSGGGGAGGAASTTLNGVTISGGVTIQ